MTRRFPGIPLLVAVVSVVACRPTPRSIAPEHLAPVSPDSVTRWVSDFTPGTRVRYDLR